MSKNIFAEGCDYRREYHAKHNLHKCVCSFATKSNAKTRAQGPSRKPKRIFPLTHTHTQKSFCPKKEKQKPKNNLISPQTFLFQRRRRPFLSSHHKVHPLPPKTKKKGSHTHTHTMAPAAVRIHNHHHTALLFLLSSPSAPSPSTTLMLQEREREREQ